MARRPFSTRPSYVQYVRGLHRLHALAVANQDDTPEADAVRDSMDRPWDELSEVEKKRITGLSEDLYSISEPSEPVLPMNPQAQRKMIEANESREAGEWDKALDLLRRWARYLEPALLSYLRGLVWRDAGDYATATLFFQHAARLDPENQIYINVNLDTLAKSDPDAALAKAREVLAADEGHPPAVVARAAQILFVSTVSLATVDALPVLQQLALVLERTLERLRSDEAKQSSFYGSTYAMVTGGLGFCYVRLGDSQAALRNYNLGLAADPENRALLVARGILRYGVEPGAVDDFEQAIHCGSPYVWPYFYLAHHYLVGNRSEECRRMCERALDFPASDEIQGNLNEWLAISRAELGFPPGQVRSAFEAAVRLAPDSERIRENFEAFEKAAAQHTWVKPGESQVKAFGQSGYMPIAA